MFACRKAALAGQHHRGVPLHAETMYQPVTHEWPPAKEHHASSASRADFGMGATVASCELAVRQGFLRKVFGILALQLSVTAGVCALFMLEPHVRAFVLASPAMLMLSFFASLGLLLGAHAYKDAHPTNLYLTLGFTLAMAWSVGVVCARFYEGGLGLVVLEAVGLTGSVAAALTAYTLRSGRDFSYLGAGLGASLWVLLLGGLIAPFTGLGGLHLMLAVGGAALFSLYIVYDVYLIARRLSPDECAHCQRRRQSRRQGRQSRQPTAPRARCASTAGDSTQQRARRAAPRPLPPCFSASAPPLAPPVGPPSSADRAPVPALALPPRRYIPAAISLYLDIINLFLHILRILASLQSRD